MTNLKQIPIPCDADLFTDYLETKSSLSLDSSEAAQLRSRELRSELQVTRQKAGGRVRLYSKLPFQRATEERPNKNTPLKMSACLQVGSQKGNLMLVTNILVPSIFRDSLLMTGYHTYARRQKLLMRL